MEIPAFAPGLPGVHESLCKWMMHMRLRKTDLLGVRRSNGKPVHTSFLLCIFKAEALRKSCCGQLPVISQIAHPKTNFHKYTMFWI